MFKKGAFWFFILPFSFTGVITKQNSAKFWVEGDDNVFRI